LLVFGSPAKSLRLQVCHIFCFLCGKPLLSFLASGSVNTRTIRFNSISRFPQRTARIFRASYTCLSICFMQFCLSVSLQIFNSIRNTHQPFVFSPRASSKIQTAGFSNPIPSPTKKCAKPLCKRHRSFPCFPIVSNLLFHLRSTRRRLAHFSLFIPLSLHSVRSVYFTNSSCPSVWLRGFLPFVRLKPYSVGFAEGSFSSFRLIATVSRTKKSNHF
jgi:hypothetical protein